MSRFSREVALASLAICLFSAGALADETTKRAKVDKMLVLANARLTLDQTMNQVKSMVSQQIGAMKISAENQAVETEIREKLFALIEDRLGWERVKPEFVKLYNDTFTEEEIDGMIAYYESATGKSVMAKMPLVAQKSVQLGIAQMQGSNVEVQRILADAMKKLPSPASKPAAPGTTPATPSNAPEKK